MTIRPPALAPGDRVRLVAPAGPVNERDFAAGLAVLGERYEAVPGSAVFARRGFLAGTDEERVRDLAEALADPAARAVIGARGGAGTGRIVDRVDLGGSARSPRWFVGSSDLTTLLLALWSRGRVLSIHGPMVATLSRQREDLAALTALLEGAPFLGPDDLTPLVAGCSEGPLLGGNLTILAHLCGPLDPSDFAGAILFLEDVGERPYRLDRCLLQLRRAGVLEHLAGVVLGEFTECDPGLDGTTAMEVLKEHLEPLGVPMAAGYPAAHGKRNLPFVHGALVRLSVGTDRVVLGEP
ncbi:MAG TPA: LD-carboxypeptidase [Polyangia bacterium]|nr:LD-carboxypeptidase [Polyangia bacterium]